MTVRPPAVAGLFYPADPAALRHVVDELLTPLEPERGRIGVKTPKAIVAPHAGYVYSGPIAATAYGRVAGADVQRVVLLGPAHRVHLEGMAVASADAFRTPLGDVAVDIEARDRLVARGLVAVDDVAHADEHSLEVHLPFLQVVLPQATVLPIAVGRATPEQIACVLDEVWGGTETLVVVSTDLSHYHDHATAAELDRRTASAVLARDDRSIDGYDACGAAPLRGLLVAARRHGLEVELLDLRTSADTAGDPDRVVGYGSFALV